RFAWGYPVARLVIHQSGYPLFESVHSSACMRAFSSRRRPVTALYMASVFSMVSSDGVTISGDPATSQTGRSTPPGSRRSTPSSPSDVGALIARDSTEERNRPPGHRVTLSTPPPPTLANQQRSG